jgi:hypothetical protein
MSRGGLLRLNAFRSTLCRAPLFKFAAATGRSQAIFRPPLLVDAELFKFGR